MPPTPSTIDLQPLDTSDIDNWVGRPFGGRQQKEAIGANDIRRWVQAMHNPNPLHYDENYAAQSIFGRLVAPLSFAAALDQGASGGIQGKLPGSAHLFGGDEWWFFGPRIYPGDKLYCERIVYDYKVTTTKFAGPTVFQRGDQTYINQRGEVIAKQRSTGIRFLVANATKLGSAGNAPETDPQWTADELEKLESEKIAYYRSFRTHETRKLKGVAVGDTLPRAVIGPRSIKTLATEWRAYIFSIWGSVYIEPGKPYSRDPGFIPELQFTADPEARDLNPALTDMLYTGGARAHTDPKASALIGMKRAYGYGSSMGAWVLDYVSNWAGEGGLIVHSNVPLRAPVFTGDATYLKGTVTAVGPDPNAMGMGLVSVQVEMSNQKGEIMAKGAAEVRLAAQ